MLKTIKYYWPAKVLVGLFIFFSIWWLYLTFFLNKSQSENPFSAFGYFGNLYGVIAAWSALFGFSIAKSWGGWRSLMGRAIIMFSFGLLFQEFGQLAYSYYIFVLHIAVPYPSIGDIGFFGTIPFYIYGIILLAEASGVRFSLNSISSKVQVIFIPLIILVVSYWLVLKNYSIDFKHPVETFLNYGYPTGPIIYISIALLTYSLTRNSLGGLMRSKILFIIIAFVAQFLAEYCFVIFQNTYYPGSILDYIYAVSYTLLGFGIFQLFTALKEYRES